MITPRDFLLAHYALSGLSELLGYMSHNWALRLHHREREREREIENK